MKVHTRNNSYLEVDDNHNEYMNNLDNLTLQLSKPLFNIGCMVSMDKYFMSTTCAIELCQNGMFCKGAIRSNSPMSATEA